MAFYRASIGGGGGETETTLWTNPSPTSTFNQQDVNLSQPYTNFKRIRFYYIVNTSHAEINQYVEHDVNDIQNWFVQGKTYPSNTYINYGALPSRYSNNQYVRIIRLASDESTSKFMFTVAYGVNYAASIQTYSIPTKITGIN